LCVTTTTEGLCGFDFNLQAATAGASGAFNITSQSVAVGWTANQVSFSDPYPINNPASLVDFGATAPALPAPVAGPTTLALATLTIAPQLSATNASYVLSPPAGLNIYTANGADCLALNSTAEVASFTFNKFVAPPPVATIAVSPGTVADSGAPLTYTVTLTRFDAGYRHVGRHWHHDRRDEHLRHYCNCQRRRHRYVHDLRVQHRCG